MKNQKEKMLLTFLSNECGFNKFSVVEKKDMISCFTKSYVDENELDSLVLSLERQGFVKIKYEDDDVYCISVLIRESEQEKKESPKNSPFKHNIVVFLSALIASFLGTIIAMLIFTL